MKAFRSIKEKRDYIEKEISLKAIDEQIQALQQQLNVAIEAEGQKESRRTKRKQRNRRK